MFTSAEAGHEKLRAERKTEGGVRCLTFIVTARRGGNSEGGTVLLRERVSPADFESGHFASQLVERIGWAVSDCRRGLKQQAPAPDAVEPAPRTDTEPQPDPIWAAHGSAKRARAPLSELAGRPLGQRSHHSFHTRRLHTAPQAIRTTRAAPRPRPPKEGSRSSALATSQNVPDDSSGVHVLPRGPPTAMHFRSPA